MDAFHERLVKTLSKKAESLGLTGPQEIKEFVTRSIRIGYGRKGDKISIAEVAGAVFRDVNAGIAELPELPDEGYTPVNLDTPEINNDNVKRATEIAKQIKSNGSFVKIDSVESLIRQDLGLVDSEGMTIMSTNEVLEHKVAMIKSLVLQTQDQTRKTGFDPNTENDFQAQRLEVDKAVNPERYQGSSQPAEAAQKIVT